MEIFSIPTGFFKLDGGAMFGVVPKMLWSRTNPADEQNRCTWAMRSLLIQNGNQLILIDNGIGNKQPQSFLKHYDLHGADSLASSIHAAGFGFDEITDNLLTHLHFDHCGGGTVYDAATDTIVPTFSNANYWVHEQHWQWATQPNAREKASFLSENLLPMSVSGQLHYTNYQEDAFPNIRLHYVDGHTERQTIPHISYKGKTIVFAADLLPSVGHIPLAYIMGYDTRPLLTLDEKAKFLNEAADNEYIIFLQHDPIHECCTVERTERGIRLKHTFPLSEIK